MKKYIFLFLYIFSTGVKSEEIQCVEPALEATQLEIITILRNCRILKHRLEVKLENKPVENIESQKMLIDATDEFNLKNANSILENNPIDKQFSDFYSIDKNVKRREENTKLIEANEEKLNELDIDLAQQEDKFDDFKNKQGEVNDLTSEDLLKQMGEIEKIDQELVRTQNEVEVSQSAIQANVQKIQDNHNLMLEKLSFLSQEREKSLDQLELNVEKLFNNIDLQINEKLGTICSALRHCGNSLAGALTANDLLELANKTGKSCEIFSCPNPPEIDNSSRFSTDTFSSEVPEVKTRSQNGTSR